MKTTEPISCTACNTGHYAEVFEKYETVAADDVKIVIPRAKLLRCSDCSDELLPPETQKQIDEAVAEQTEQLTPHEIEAIWEKFNLDQTQAAEALGLGGKTFHRWLNGSQYPSRSMGYYLRVLAEFPLAFEWVKERRWRRQNRIVQFQQINLALQFPDLAMAASQGGLNPPNKAMQPNLTHSRFNPAELFQKTRVR